MFTELLARAHVSGIGIAIAVVAALAFTPHSLAAQTSPSITATPVTVSPGAPITVTVANGPGLPSDWVALAATGAPDTSYVAWAYLNGTMSLPATGLTSATLPLAAPTTPGTYNVRLFTNSNGWTKLATSSPVTVQTQPALTISNATVTEGSSGTTPATFTVTVSPTSPNTVTVNYATANGTATAGSDYVAASGTLTFAPGTATQAVTVLVNGSTTPGPTKTFVVTLSSPTNAVVGGGAGVGTIVNVNVPPPPTVTASATVSPGGAITVTVANGPGLPSDWVALAATGAPDTSYVAWAYLNGTMSLPATGLTSATLPLAAPTTPGTYNVRLFTNSNGWTKLATSSPVTVQTPPALTISNATVTEGSSGTTPATFTVTVSPTSLNTVTVNYATANGTATAGSDYVAASGTLTFAPGTATQAVTVLVNGSTTPGPTKTFVVTLSSPTNAVVGGGAGVGTIVNVNVPPPPTVTASATVSPGGAITVTVANGPGLPNDWVALAATGAPDTSYVAWAFLNGTMSLPATGLTSATLPLAAPTTPGTYSVRLFTNGWTKLATSSPVTVQTQPALTISNATVTEGSSGTTPATFTVTVSPTSPNTVTVNYATANGTATAGSDYVAASGTLTFAPGTATQAVTVLVNGSTTPGPTKTFVVTLSSPTNAVVGGGAGVGTIVNVNVPPPPTVAASATVSPGGAITVTVANGPGLPSDWVALAATGAPDTSYVAWAYLNGTMSLPATGLTSATLPLAAPTTPGTYNVRLFTNGWTKLATSSPVTVQTPPALTISNATVTEGSSGTTPATFTVTVSPTSPNTVTVNYATANGTATAGSDYVAASGTLTFAPGTATQAVTVLVNGSTTPGPTKTFVVTLSSPTNAVVGGGAGVGTIVNVNVPPPPTVTASATVSPGGAITVTVANGPGLPSDWVALAATGAPDTSYVAWAYLNGTMSLPATGLTSATLPLAAPTTPGTYNVRLFTNGWTKLATSSPVTVQTPPALTISNATVTEGSSGTTPATFTVTVSPTSPNTVTVNYATANGTATAGSDYVAASGTLTFAPGTATRSVTVLVNGSTTPGPTKTFVVTLSSPTNAVLGGGAGVGTIVNANVPPPATVTAPAAVSPGGAITVTVANGPGLPNDWVALAATGAPDTSYVAWAYLNGTTSLPATGLTSATLPLAAPTTLGTYNVRLFTNGWTKLATSSAVTVGDTTPPTVAISSPSGGATVTGALTVSATASDNIGVVGVQFRLDGASLGAEVLVAPYAVSWTTTTAANGLHTLTAVARDAAANQTTSAAVSVTVANPPVISAVAASAITVSGATISWTTTTASDSQVAYGLTTAYGSTSALNTGLVTSHSIALSSLAATTTYHYRVQSRDAGANLAVSGDFTFTTLGDVTPPTVSISAPTGGATVTGAVPVSATASDNVGVVGVQFRLDGAVLGAEVLAAPYTVSWTTTTAANGLHTLTAVARDAAANQTTSAAVSVTVANPPVISAVAASAITVSGATISWTTTTASDSQVAYGLTTAYGSTSALNTGLVTSHSIALSSLAATTTYHYQVRSRDAAGNLALSGDGTFTTLTAPPVISAVAASAITVSGATISWTTTTASDSQVAYGLTTAYGSTSTLNSSLVTSHSIALSSLAATTTYHYQVLSRDAAGNLALSGDGTFTTLTAPPVISAVAASAITVSGATISWTTTTASDSQVAYGLTTAYGSTSTLNSSLVTSHSVALSGLAASTTYHYRVQSRDAGANLAVSGDFTFTTLGDVTPPTVSISAPTGGATVTGAVPVSATASDNVGVVGVQFRLDGAVLGAEVLAAPYTVSWTTTTAANGLHTLTAVARDAAANQTTSAAVSVTVANPPVISAVAASAITVAGATISWTTTTASDSQVNYGLTTAYGSTSALNTGLVTSHSIALSGLAATTTYHYQVLSRDAAGNLALSGDGTFTTLTAPPVISAVAASAITVSGATISWTTTTASDSQVAYGLTTAYGSTSTLNSSLVTSHSIALSGLAATTTYHYQVLSRDAAGNLALSGDGTFTTLTAPPVISAVAASAITVSGATISWTTTTASDSQVAYGLTTAYGSTSTLNSSLVTSHSVALSGLAASTTYHYRVQSRDAGANLAVSGDFTFTTLGDVTPPTVSISAPTGGATVTGAVPVSATASDNVGVVGVQFRLDGAVLGAEVLAAPYTVSWTTTTAANGLHTLTAVARDAAANQTTSAAVSVTVANPPVISAVAASAITVAGATISWTTTTASDSQVNYGLTTAYGSTSALNTGLVTSHSIALSGLAATTTYHYQVLSRDAAGNLALSGDGTFTTLTAPPVISAVAASAITVSGATISWTTTTASDSQVAYGLTTAYGSTSTLNTSLVTSHSIALSSLAATTTYHYQVRSRDAAGNLALSGDGTFTTLTAPPVISAVAASAITVSGATISWTTTTASDSQVVYGLTTAYGTTSTLNTSLVTSHSIALSGLAATTTYHYQVRSRDAAGNLALSGDGTFTTLTAPPVISGVAAVSITSSGATIGWTTNTASDSQVDYGLTTAYGSTSPLIGTLVTTHAVILGALTGGTTYHVRVRSKDAAGNLALSGDFSFITLPADVTPPVVAITAPAANATVSGTITFSATATDNVGGSGMAGVEFKLDGVDLAPEDTVAPYTVAWDTTTASAGVHTLTAVAWDVAGNQATATLTVTVANATAQVQLAWDTDTMTVAGYKVKVGTSSGVYSTANIDVGNVTAFTVTGLAPGHVYYLAVTAYDSSGAESLASNEVSVSK